MRYLTNILRPFVLMAADKGGDSGSSKKRKRKQTGDKRARFRQGHSTDSKPTVDPDGLSKLTGLPQSVTVTVEIDGETVSYECRASLFGADKTRVGYLLQGTEQADGIGWRLNGQLMISGDAGKVTDDEREKVRPGSAAEIAAKEAEKAGK